MVGTGTNTAVTDPKARVLAGGGRLKVTTRDEENDCVEIAGVDDTIASKVALYEADEVSEPKNKTN